MSGDEDLRGRGLWMAMPWALATACSQCGQVLYCHGRSRERMICLACFAGNGYQVKLRRSGKRGERSAYTYRARRSKQEQIARAHALRDEGYSVTAIHFEIGVSKRTVSSYLSAPLPAAQSRSGSGLNVIRKEEGGS